MIEQLYATKQEAFEAGKSVGRLDLDEHAKRRTAELVAALEEIAARTSAYAGDDQNWPLASGINDVARKALRKT